MEERFLQQLKKGVLEMMVLEAICRRETYGYELLTTLREANGGLFSLKEGTLYPILYRLEDEGLILSSWSQGAGRNAPKKMYAATEKGLAQRLRHRQVWKEFLTAVDGFYREESE